MIAARIGPIGTLKLPSADAVVADAVNGRTGGNAGTGSEVSCAAVVVSTSAGSLLVTLAATAGRRDAPRACRLTVAAAVNVSGSAAGPPPVPVDGGDTDGRDTAAGEATSFTAPAGAGIGRATTDLLPIDADGAGPE